MPRSAVQPGRRGFDLPSGLFCCRPSPIEPSATDSQPKTTSVDGKRILEPCCRMRKSVGTPGSLAATFPTEVKEELQEIRQLVNLSQHWKPKAPNGVGQPPTNQGEKRWQRRRAVLPSAALPPWTPQSSGRLRAKAVRPATGAVAGRTRAVSRWCVGIEQRPALFDLGRSGRATPPRG